jgi:hypothetical protein
MDMPLKAGGPVQGVSVRAPVRPVRAFFMIYRALKKLKEIMDDLGR